MAASGVHHLVANHHLILSETCYRSFEVPLLHVLDEWKQSIEEEDLKYNKECKNRAKEIRRLEKEGVKLQQQRKRDVNKFRGHLVTLTGLLDGFTTLHASHARMQLLSSQETSGKIVESASSLVRGEMEIYEGLARKGWNGGGLDDLLDKSSDPFTSEQDMNGGGADGSGGREIRSILPTKSILPSLQVNPDLADRRGSGQHGRYNSLSAALSDYGGDEDRTSIFAGPNIDDVVSPTGLSKGIRPFSPPPGEGSRGRRREGEEREIPHRPSQLRKADEDFDEGEEGIVREQEEGDAAAMKHADDGQRDGESESMEDGREEEVREDWERTWVVVDHAD
jgi:hypothetical protein